MISIEELLREGGETVTVVDGGALGGKSYNLETVAKLEYGTRTVIVPESATAILGSAWPRVGKDMSFGPEWLLPLQEAILSLQVNNERARMAELRQKGGSMLLCDRGALSAAAYLPGGIQQLEEILQIDASVLFARYDRLVYFQSIAAWAPERYYELRGTNPNRYETLEEAQLLEKRTRAIYELHPNALIIEGADGFEGMTAQFREFLSEHLDICVERRWKVKLEALPNLDPHPSKEIRMGYLSERGKNEQRVREIGATHYQGTKAAKSDVSRRRWEHPISKPEFEALWQDTEGSRVHKRRHFVPEGRYKLKVDTSPLWKGWAYVECEFPTMSASLAYDPPSWLQNALEVTGDWNHSNRALAR